MTRIFITGCARSGTTLLNRLFHAFEDTEVIGPETSIDDFCALECNKAFLVAKRIPLTILSVPLSENELSRQLALLRRHDLRIVNLIRDGRDVVHQNPTGPRVNVNRWIGCILQAQMFRESISTEIRYEDMVKDPSAVQERLVKSLGLRCQAKFSSYPAFVPDIVFDEAEYRNFPYYRKRPIDLASLGHSATEYIALCQNREEKGLFERTLARLGYIDGQRQTPWNPTVLAKEHAIFRKISKQLGHDLNTAPLNGEVSAIQKKE